jgi:hypothetical protein
MVFPSAGEDWSTKPSSGPQIKFQCVSQWGNGELERARAKTSNSYKEEFGSAGEQLVSKWKRSL